MLLAIDTATHVLSIALATETHVIAETTWKTNNQHSVELAPAIERLLQQTGSTPHNLSALAVAQGPGSFTGVRIGLGLAKGMALALSIPLIPVQTLDTIAEGTPPSPQPLTAVIQAGRSRIIAAPYRHQGEQWIQSGELVLTTWEDLIPQLPVGTICNGELDAHGLELLQAHRIQVMPLGWQIRRAGFLAQVAWRRPAAPDPALVMPIYMK
ncbi:MAG: tRNA (adenosine(37)-N6)-threonylcarbamoyltransferase complex dimerization subunit type 1 TsaB [Anaerolineales bacterium]|nr:tRNA (adenosine(37)-N6)-threonylcarbamoyltransferase complex dimerization subunit type 1 TsaB [Anaerolineales bacterium]